MTDTKQIKNLDEMTEYQKWLKSEFAVERGATITDRWFIKCRGMTISKGYATEGRARKAMAHRIATSA